MGAVRPSPHATCTSMLLAVDLSVRRVSVVLALWPGPSRSIGSSGMRPEASVRVATPIVSSPQHSGKHLRTTTNAEYSRIHAATRIRMGVGIPRAN